MQLVPGMLAVVMITGGAIALYLTSPNQKLLAARWPWWRGLVLGASGLLSGLVALLQVAGPATAVFRLLTLLMVVWTLLPLACGWLRRAGGPAA